jgi:hypothetical protein
MIVLLFRGVGVFCGVGPCPGCGEDRVGAEGRRAPPLAATVHLIAHDSN